MGIRSHYRKPSKKGRYRGLEAIKELCLKHCVLCTVVIKAAYVALLLSIELWLEASLNRIKILGKTFLLFQKSFRSTFYFLLHTKMVLHKFFQLKHREEKVQLPKGGFMSEDTGKILRLQHKYSKLLSWAENLNFPPKTVNNLFKFSAQDSNLDFLKFGLFEKGTKFGKILHLTLLSKVKF